MNTEQLVRGLKMAVAARLKGDQILTEEIAENVVIDHVDHYAVMSPGIVPKKQGHRVTRIVGVIGRDRIPFEMTFPYGLGCRMDEIIEAARKAGEE